MYNQNHSAAVLPESIKHCIYSLSNYPYDGVAYTRNCSLYIRYSKPKHRTRC